MKTFISDGLISEALILMQAMKKNDCFDAVMIDDIKTYYGINKQAALSLAVQCNWLSIDDNDTYLITSYGDQLLNQFDGTGIRAVLYRAILRGYITSCSPIWARKVPYGRREAYQIMSDEEKVCFEKAGLINGQDSADVVRWWDELAEIERQKIDHKKGEVGRKGELLTLQYEKQRTKTEPVWESIETNLAGCDVRSQ